MSYFAFHSFYEFIWFFVPLVRSTWLYKNWKIELHPFHCTASVPSKISSNALHQKYRHCFELFRNICQRKNHTSHHWTIKPLFEVDDKCFKLNVHRVLFLKQTTFKISVVFFSSLRYFYFAGMLWLKSQKKPLYSYLHLKHRCRNTNLINLWVFFPVSFGRPLEIDRVCSSLIAQSQFINHRSNCLIIDLSINHGLQVCLFVCLLVDDVYLALSV